MRSSVKAIRLLHVLTLTTTFLLLCVSRLVHAEPISDQQLSELVTHVNYYYDDEFSKPAREKLIENGDELWPRLYRRWTESGDVGVLRALWTIRKDPSLAKDVATLIEKIGFGPGSIANEYIRIIDTPVGRKYIPAEVRLTWILEHELPFFTNPVDYPTFKLKGPVREHEALLCDEEEVAFLKQHADLVRDRTFSLLEDDGDVYAGLILALIGEQRALPYLRHHYITSTEVYFYGWEGGNSRPDLLDSDSYYTKYMYQKSIEHLTGKKLEEVISLTPGEIAFLEKRAEPADRYILFQLAPDAAADVIFQQYRDAPKDNRVLEAEEVSAVLNRSLARRQVWTDEPITAKDLDRILSENMKRREVIRALGAPDRRCEMSDAFRKLMGVPRGAYIEIYDLGKFEPLWSSVNERGTPKEHILILAYRGNKLEFCWVGDIETNDRVEAIYSIGWYYARYYNWDPSDEARVAALTSKDTDAILFGMAGVTFGGPRPRRSIVPGNTPEMRSAVEALRTHPDPRVVEKANKQLQEFDRQDRRKRQ